MRASAAKDHTPGSMALTVIVRSGDSEQPPTITFDAPRIVIGRGDGCEVRLPDPSVSHRHASLRQRGIDYIVLDEGSTNGTFVGPVRLSPQAPRVVKSGDLIRVGRIWLELRIEQALATADAKLATREIALGLVASAMSAAGESAAPHIAITDGADAGRDLQLREPDRTYVVGRGRDVDLALDDPDASRRHLEVVRRGDQIWVKELGSKNGARLGGEPMPPSTALLWSRRAVLEIGSDRLVVRDPVAEALAELERSQDERLSEDESVDPPRTDGDAGDATEAPEESDALGDLTAADPGAPVAPILRRAEPRAVTRLAARGWTGTDWLVALLALAVLAVSGAGLWWLFRME